MENKNMKKNDLLFIVIIIAVIVFISCNDFLDKNPDQRMEWKTPKQISDLLVNAYSTANYGVIGELSSDNMIDNQAPDSKGKYQNYGPFDRFHDELFAWEPATSGRDQDSPFTVWEEYYHAIAVCNHALQTIEKMKEEDPKLDLDAQKGEALISRAYHHFILVNIFSQTYKDENQTDYGIPYVTEPETKVKVEYNRKTVPYVYQQIEKDIEAGIGLVKNSYKQPKYHFNISAAHAFAARFYLFKRDWEKVIEHANIVLGNGAVLRNWTDIPTGMDAKTYWWIDEKSANNLLLMPTYSWLMRVSLVARYGHARDAYEGTLGYGGPSGNMNKNNGRTVYSWSACSDCGYFFAPVNWELFEYTDKIAGIGMGHNVRVEFSAEETLLCRAEAKIHLKDIDGALDDFTFYEQSRYATTQPLTRASIERVFTNISNKPKIYKDLNCDKISSSWIVEPEKEPFIHCVLFYRRWENIHNGMRWFDLKRYGIEYWHKIAKDSTYLKVNDQRRAIQIPKDVIDAGLQRNPRDEVFSPKFKVNEVIELGNNNNN